MAVKFESSLFIEIIKNASSNGFLIQTDNGKVAPLTQGVKGTIIEPSQAIKEMLFGDSKETDELSKALIVALGGRVKYKTGGGRRGRKPKVAKV